MTDPGPSWLRSLPDAQPVTRRDVSVCTVTALFDGYFSARVQGEKRRRYFDAALVADEDRAPLVVGARFWEVAEWTRQGVVEITSGLAFQQPGLTVERAFARRTENADA